MPEDPKSIKKTIKMTVFFALLRSARVKAAHKTLMKLTPALAKAACKMLVNSTPALHLDYIEELKVSS